MIFWIVFVSFLIMTIIIMAHYKAKMNCYQEKYESTKNMLNQQVRLTDAYAWQVETKRYELMEALGELRKMHEKSIAMNDKLEEEVAIRARALDFQNKKIIEYHFINAHKLRAPVARILGLTSLIIMETKGDKDSMILNRLKQTGEELDEIVHVIQKTLDTAEYHHISKSA